MLPQILKALYSYLPGKGRGVKGGLFGAYCSLRVARRNSLWTTVGMTALGLLCMSFPKSCRETDTFKCRFRYLELGLVSIHSYEYLKSWGVENGITE